MSVADHKAPVELEASSKGGRSEMHPSTTFRRIAVVILAFGLLAGSGTPAAPQVGNSPWGTADEIGRLNLITPASRAAIVSRIVGGDVYDLSVGIVRLRVQVAQWTDEQPDTELSRLPIPA